MIRSLIVSVLLMFSLPVSALTVEDFLAVVEGKGSAIDVAMSMSAQSYYLGAVRGALTTSCGYITPIKGEVPLDSIKMEPAEIRKNIITWIDRMAEETDTPKEKLMNVDVTIPIAYHFGVKYCLGEHLEQNGISQTEYINRHWSNGD